MKKTKNKNTYLLFISIENLRKKNWSITETEKKLSYKIVYLPKNKKREYILIESSRRAKNSKTKKINAKPNQMELVKYHHRRH